MWNFLWNGLHCERGVWKRIFPVGGPCFSWILLISRHESTGFLSSSSDSVSNPWTDWLNYCFPLEKIRFPPPPPPQQIYHLNHCYFLIPSTDGFWEIHVRESEWSKKNKNLLSEEDFHTPFFSLWNSVHSDELSHKSTDLTQFWHKLYCSEPSMNRTKTTEKTA